MSARAHSSRRFTVRVRRGLRMLADRPVVVDYHDRTGDGLDPQQRRDLRAAREWIAGLRRE